MHVGSMVVEPYVRALAKVLNCCREVALPETAEQTKATVLRLNRPESYMESGVRLESGVRQPLKRQCSRAVNI